MKQATLFSLLFLVLFFTTLTLAFAISPAPAAAPKAPTKPHPTPKATAPSPKPLVPTLPESPDSPDSVPDDITRILKKAKSFTVLTRLLKTTEIMNNINSQLITAKSGGITILAPDDSAFSQLKAGFLNSLNEGQKIELVQFHILPEFVSSSNFDSLSNPVQTVAGKDPARLPLNVNALGNSVNISTGVVNATILGVVYSDNKLAIYHVDKVLLPLDFFVTKAPALAPTTLAKAPKAAKENSSEDDQDETNHDHQKSGSVGFVNVRGTTLVSLGMCLVAFATMWS
ncbi:fasciclin-like arabinogalactan protein 12 [Abrus precatorius]|uniref:Fasciclin-like arabinogalactan protein 12 n=1 Tax=Abrus precatorius TaxID=3816 RepID=A0A8B8KP99_ABRPR|nr:fasciclin-like arabinogalactan protein 12 [Abrus precatorius]